MKKYLILLCVLWLGTVQAEPRLRPTTWAAPVIGTELKNLYQVDKEVYRSSQPEDEDTKDLKSLGVREVLNLREYHSDNDDLPKKDFTLHRIQMEAGSVTEQQLIDALNIIKNRKGPILIHCWHGSDRTGATVAAYRLVFNNWTKQQALDEMTNGGYGYHATVYPNLVELINNLDVVKMKKALGIAKGDYAGVRKSSDK